MVSAVQWEEKHKQSVELCDQYKQKVADVEVESKLLSEALAKDKETISSKDAVIRSLRFKKEKLEAINLNLQKVLEPIQRDVELNDRLGAELTKANSRVHELETELESVRALAAQHRKLAKTRTRGLESQLSDLKSRYLSLQASSRAHSQKLSCKIATLKGDLQNRSIEAQEFAQAAESEIIKLTFALKQHTQQSRIHEENVEQLKSQIKNVEISQMRTMDFENSSQSSDETIDIDEFDIKDNDSTHSDESESEELANKVEISVLDIVDDSDVSKSNPASQVNESSNAIGLPRSHESRQPRNITSPPTYQNTRASLLRTSPRTPESQMLLAFNGSIKSRFLTDASSAEKSPAMSVGLRGRK